MLQVHSWDNVILHLDGDAFFASVYQAVRPELKGKPVITGSERGLATAVSYEARKYGIKRGHLTWQAKKMCPNLIVLPSDYDLYNLFSQKMFNIMRKYTPLVEEYSCDEGFADIKGLQRPLNKSYKEIAQAVKDEIETSLGITVSVGVSLTKSLAKLASSFRKPSGLTVVEGRHIQYLLKNVPVSDIWGVGAQTAAYMNKLGIYNAFDFASKSDYFVKKHFYKPQYEIWLELRGEKVYDLNITGKQTYKGISHTGTFSPSTNDPNILNSKLLTHVEQAFMKARRAHYRAGKIYIFLKTQDFHYHSAEIKLIEKVLYPFDIRDEVTKAFRAIYRKGVLYRASGCHITDLQEDNQLQLSLFSDSIHREETEAKLYKLYEQNKVDFGSSLFDKDRKIERTKPKKFTLPTLSILD